MRSETPWEAHGHPVFDAQDVTRTFHTLLYRARQRKPAAVFALGQRLRHFADYIATTAGTANGARVRRWFQDKRPAGTCP